jgi:hypothetical protein
MGQETAVTGKNRIMIYGPKTDGADAYALFVLDVP